VLTEPSLQGQWDESLEQAATLERVDPLTILRLTRTRAQRPLAPRELVAVERCARLPDGSLIAHGASVEHPPLESGGGGGGGVRAEALFTAVHVQPLSDESCKVTLAEAVDPKGTAAKLAARGGSSRLARSIHAVSELVRSAPGLVSRARAHLQRSDVPAILRLPARRTASPQPQPQPQPQQQQQQPQQQAADAKESEELFDWPVDALPDARMASFVRASEWTHTVAGLRSVLGAAGHVIGFVALRLRRLHYAMPLVFALQNALQESLALFVRASVGSARWESRRMELINRARGSGSNGVGVGVLGGAASPVDPRPLDCDDACALPVTDPRASLVISLYAFADQREILLGELSMSLDRLCDQKGHRGCFSLSGPHHIGDGKPTLLEADLCYRFSRVADVLSDYDAQLQSLNARREEPSIVDGPRDVAYSPENLVDAGMEALKALRPLHSSVAATVTVRSWQRPWLSAAVLALFVALFLWPPLFGLVLAALALLAWMLSFAENQLREGQNEFEPPLAAPSAVEQTRLRGELVDAVRRLEGRVPRAALQQMQDRLTALTRTARLLFGWLAWSDPDVALLVYALLLGASLVAHLFSFAWLLVTVVTVLFFWNNEPVLSLRWLAARTVAVRRRMRQRAALAAASR
jgi:hypothetical protein